jgi:hypothetical protein
LGERDHPMALGVGPTLILLAGGRARRFGGIKPLAPVGPQGEAVIDLGVSDALEAGFSDVIVVVNPKTGPVIEKHIAASWPSQVSVSFAVQAVPRGTVDAVCTARSRADPSKPFGVVNADDLYGVEALRMVVTTLAGGETNMMVGFRLDRALVGSDPVTRGVCEIEGGKLRSIQERRQVVATAEGFVADDGLEPRLLPGETVVSMNLWGFQPSMWAILRWAMDQATDASEDNEVLLPELIGRLVGGELDAEFPGSRELLVASTSAHCVGVTHPDDLALVQAEIRAEIATGQRAPQPFAQLLA